jgi:hypothetical protein
MARFLAWFAETSPLNGEVFDGLARTAIAHLWFESIHPFEDGNGHIGRAIRAPALIVLLNGLLRLRLELEFHGFAFIRGVDLSSDTNVAVSLADVPFMDPYPEDHEKMLYRR